MNTLRNPEEVTARQEHRCNFCNGRIIVREKYMKSTHSFEGTIYDWKAHKRCNALVSELDMHKDCIDGLTQECFIEIVSDKHDDLLFALVPSEDNDKYRDITHQLSRVNFMDKLGYVIRHFHKYNIQKMTLKTAKT